MQVFPDDVEFYSRLNVTNPPSLEKLNEIRREELNSRVGSSDLILGLAIPWGLMPVFVGVGTVPGKVVSSSVVIC